MSYRLLYFIGRFVHDGNFAAIQRDENLRASIPKPRQPLIESDGDAQRSAIEFCDGDSSRVRKWDLKFEDNFITFCEFGDAKALAWILEFVRTRNLDFIEGGTMRVVPHSELGSLAASTK
jgi:hypothetical protein